MKSTILNFKEKQSNSLKLLQRLFVFLQQGQQAGISIDPSLINKLHQQIMNVEEQKLKVALVGGFSEGKTSIAAAWMEKLDKSTMKISHKESSNEVKVYEINDEFVLVDTPGLFGFKEQKNSDTDTIEKYKDITKKHVSEAHLVLYVMNSTNPIKESHKDDLEWLFRTLNLLPRTVFVLSRFDEVADIEDEDEYQEHLEIKKNNIITRLESMISLTPAEIDELSIVAVSANPFDKGTEYWLNNIKEFNAISHINLLREATAKKIKENGGSDALDVEMKASVIGDILHKQLPIAIKADNVVSDEVNRLQKMHTTLKDQLNNTNAQIEVTRVNLRDFVSDYFSDLITQTIGCSLETFGKFFEREIGSEGIIVSNNLQNEFSRQMGAINLTVEKMQTNFNSEINHFNTTVRSLGKEGVNYALKGNIINNQTILATRDGIVGVAKTLGMDIGKYLKFKPYGAINLAKGVNNALAFVGVALEVWDSYDSYKKEKEFKNSISELKQSFEKQRDDLITLINSDEFKIKFFSGYIELKKQLDELNKCLDESEQLRQEFSEWKREAELLEGELVALN